MAAKKKKKPAAKGKQGRKAREKDLDEAALKAAYLEMYAARDGRQKLSRLRTKLGVRIETLDRWEQDEQFVAARQGIDARRLQSAEGLATTIWPQIVERQAALALAEIPDPPPEPPRDSPDYAYRVRMNDAGHRAACATAVKMSTRAAEFIGKYLGQLHERASELGLVGGPGGEVFGKLSDYGTPKELANELARLDDVVAAYKAHKAAKEGKGGEE